MLLAKYDAKQEWKEWCQNKDLSRCPGVDKTELIAGYGQ